MNSALALSVLFAISANAQAKREAPAVPELKGGPLGPSLRGPTEPDPQAEEEPGLLRAPVPVEEKLFSRLVDHVRKHCSNDEESGLCCLTGQSMLKKSAPTRTACLDIEIPEAEPGVQQAVYRETLRALTIVTAQAKGKPPIVEYTTLEMGMGGSVTQAEMEAEGAEGVQHRKDPMKPEEAKRLFEGAAKDLLTITPKVKV